MSFRLDTHLEPSGYLAALREDVRAGLTSTPKALPPKWLYDETGSDLFDQITRLEEYYPTRAERSILLEHADDIAKLSQATTLVELGSGTSEKTRLLLTALRDAGTLETFVPFDVDPTVLTAAGDVIARDYPGIDVTAVAGDFDRHLGELPTGGRRMVAFLGSTIGNFEPAGRARFLASLADTLAPGDSLLLGADLVKDPSRLVAAYNDAPGVTARFTRNVLTVVNRELDANADVASFAHLASWDADNEWVDIRLHSLREQEFHIGALDLDVHVHREEEIRVEISAKFRRERVEAELAAAGLTLTSWWTDMDDDFALSLAVRE